MDIHKQIASLAEDMASCTKILTAIGDETRQYLILEMMRIGNCNGVRVCQITERTKLSRPAVSHHLQILKDAKILKMRKEGTKNYYYFDPEMESFEKLIAVWQRAVDISKSLPDRGGQN